ncbi:hypothetical protein GCM10007938_37080 [Vibrio zhanjiangensis]|uniref:Uncharacterized protein n=1 Tax=Vibrio zhanjiangensis TaxID=1046128 RepID=A0ABQ6F5U9_9VIBR|nr:hypothetical protein [Vibrio zhanjiangensis]GLT19925.1 hypothetical protein GCM10007938_37080 [Vibrio zhanjiangensis]
MERYAYFSPAIVSAEELRGAYAFAVDIAKKHNSHLTVLVNSISNSEQFLEKIFTEQETNKLRRYETIVKNGLSIELKSPDGFKDYQSYGVILAIHSSPKAINKIESNDQTLAVIAVAEINHLAEHLTNWKTEKGVKEFKQQDA